MPPVNIPHGDPGTAGFDSETYVNAPEPRYNDTPATTTSVTVTASGGAIDLPIFSVVSLAAPGMALAVQGDPVPPYGILTTSLKLADGETASVGLYRTGHFDSEALNWDVSFNTEAKREKAFEGSASPTLFVSRKKNQNDAVNI